MFGLETKEIIIIAVVLVLLFGAKKIPELSKSVVEAIQHLKTAFRNSDEPSHDVAIDTTKKK